MKKHLGFTLIELMVVMAIIAILATAGLAAYTSYIKKANDSKNVAMLSELNSITEMFRDATGQLPANIETLVTQYYNSRGAIAENQQIPSVAWIHTLFGVSSAFAIPNASDPTKILVAGGETGCAYYTGTKIAYDGPCAVYFLKFSDDSYAWGVGVRTAGAVTSSFQLDTSSETSYSSPETNNIPITPLIILKGNNKALNTQNTNTLPGVPPVKVSVAVKNIFGTIGTPTFTISIKSSINVSSIPPTVINESSSTEEESSSTEVPTTTDCSSVGQVCSDGTVYVNASLRTTTGNEADSTPSGGLSICTAKGAGWRLPTISELIILCNNRNLIGNWLTSGYGWYHSSTTNGGTHVTGVANGCTDSTWGPWVSHIRCVKS